MSRENNKLEGERNCKKKKNNNLGRIIKEVNNTYIHTYIHIYIYIYIYIYIVCVCMCVRVRGWVEIRYDNKKKS